MQCLQGPAAPLQMHAAAAARLAAAWRLQESARPAPSPGCQLSSGLQTIIELNGSGQQRAANNAGDRHSGSVAFAAGEQALAFRSVAALDFEGCRVQAPRCASQLSSNRAAHPQAIHSRGHNAAGVPRACGGQGLQKGRAAAAVRFGQPFSAALLQTLLFKNTALAPHSPHTKPPSCSNRS